VEVRLALVVAALWVALAAVAMAAPPPIPSGRVVRVKDGDSIVILTAANRQVELRLFGIDSPEKGQPYGDRAKQATSRLCFGKTVRLVPHEKDRYGRTLADVYLPDGTSLNRTLVSQGWAWRYRYSTDPTLLRLQQAARTARRGLWADPHPIDPWAWRRRNSTR